MACNVSTDKIGLPCSSAGKESAYSAGDPGLIAGLGRSSGKGLGYPLQYPWAFLTAQLVKNLPAMQEAWIGMTPRRREWPASPEFWPGDFQGL